MGTLYRSDGVTWDRIGDGAALAAKIEGWHNVGAAGEPAFQNAWVNYGPSDPPLAFKKYPDGRVRLQGIVKNGAVGQPIFTLPVGYRPPIPSGGAIRFTCANNGVGIVDLHADGTVWLITGVNAWLDLSGIEFDTGQTTWPTGQGSGLGVVTSLPIAPVDGQECYFLADATAGVNWHLKYRAASASAYKWEFIGGGYLFARQGAAFTAATGSGAYADPGASMPTVTVPLAGDYDVYAHGHSFAPTAATNETNVALNGGGLSGSMWVGGVNQRMPFSVSDIRAGVAAATALRPWFSANGQNLTHAQYSVRARPQRVG